MKERHWLWPAVVSSIILMLIAAALVMKLRPETGELTGARIAIDGELALRHVATLSEKNNSYSEDGRGLKDSLWMKVPPSIRMRFRYRPSTPFEINYSSIDPGDVRLIMRVEYPEEWLQRLKDYEIREKIDKALDAAGMKYVRARHIDGSYTSPASVYVTQEAADYDAHGRLLSAKPYINAAIDGLPFYAEVAQLEFLSEWDGKSTVTKGFEFNNPYYHKPDPLRPADPLPQTVADGGLEVTLRQVVAKIADEPQIQFRQEDGVMHVASPSVRRPMPLSEQLPPGFFPRAKGTAQDPFHTLIQFEIKQAGQIKADWGISDVDVFYDKALHEFKISGWSSTGRDGVSFLSFAGDLSYFGPSVKVAVKLRRNEKFPSDELQTVELPLPGDGESITSGATVRLWNGAVTVNQVAYNVAGPVNEFVAPKADRLSVLFETTKGGNASLRDAFFVKNDGTTMSLDSLRASSGSSNYRSVYHYDLIRDAGRPRDEKPIMYDEFTSIGLTFVSPREYPKKFEYFAQPVEATGKWEPEN